MTIISYREFDEDNMAETDLNYMKWLFYEKWGRTENIYDYLYILTYWPDIQNINNLIIAFKKTNFKLCKLIGGDNQANGYLPFQHSGVVYIDHENSRKSKFQQKLYGFHIHSIVVVHPEWQSKFVKSVKDLDGARYSEVDLSFGELFCADIEGKRRGIHVRKINSSEDDALRALSYIAKAVTSGKGFQGDFRLKCIDTIGLKPCDQNIKKVDGPSNLKHFVREISLTGYSIRSRIHRTNINVSSSR